MDHGRPGSLHTADTFVPSRDTDPFRPLGGPDTVRTPVAPPRIPTTGRRRSTARDLLVGAASATTAVGIAVGILLSASPGTEPVGPLPAPDPVAADLRPTHCDDEVRTVTGRVAVRRDVRGVPVGVMVVGTTTVCGDEVPAR